MSHFLKMPEDPWGLLGPGPPGTAVHIGEGLTIPYGGSTQRGQRAREGHLSRKHAHQGLPHMLSSEPLDMGLRRKAEERKLS